MNMHCQKFLESLGALSSGAKTAAREVQDEWFPEDPPITTLFAAVGDRIAEEFDDSDEHASRAVSSLIEDAMESNDSTLVTAVATGLIEALVTRAVRGDARLWKRMALFLGPRSLHHAEAWLAA